MMTISVIVSSYNNDRYLALFLDSLERQQRRPDEVIIADDGSAVAIAVEASAFPPILHSLPIAAYQAVSRFLLL